MKPSSASTCGAASVNTDSCFTFSCCVHTSGVKSEESAASHRHLYVYIVVKTTCMCERSSGTRLIIVVVS